MSFSIVCVPLPNRIQIHFLVALRLSESTGIDQSIELKGEQWSAICKIGFS